MKMLYQYLCRIFMFCIIGGTGFVVGLALQWALVELLGVPDIGAFTIQLPVTILLNYELNRKLTWRSRQQGTMQAVQFFGSRLFTAGLAWVLYALLAQVLGLPYMVANAIATVTVMALNFVIGEDFIFKHVAQQSAVEPLPQTEATPSMQLSRAR